MKLFLSLVAFFCFSTVFSQDGSQKKMAFDKSKKTYELETACGTCMFKMKGNTCKLAVKIKNKDYFVEGTGIDDHGDAHSKDGFCNSIRKAKVQGEIQGDKFLVTYFELIK
ncbi:MAG: hypothetical protein B7Y15_10840 [Bacteroidetes bacterium 24-39-8]|jgi:hypothetical protein|nr:MAG: hypothetical protein B7Y15_10840 [Bacteroidetes bacterium 24-39-8]HQS54998.1 DUF6370 family protein [Sediminibacterium sp.]